MFFLVIIAIVVAVVLFSRNHGPKAQKKEEDKTYTSYERDFNTARHNLNGQRSAIDSSINQFFAGRAAGADGMFNSEIKTLNGFVEGMKATIREMYGIKTMWTSDFPKSTSPSSIENSIKELENTVVADGKHVADEFKAFAERATQVASRSYTKMMDWNNYGQINKEYWDEVSKIKREDAASFISSCENLLNSKNFSAIFDIDLEMILKCAWVFAIDKKFSPDDLRRAADVYLRIFKNNSVDFTIAEWYAKTKMGSEDAIRDDINKLLKNNPGSLKLTLITSALMWMDAYKSEHTVLQHMLTSGMEMSEKAQERLHSLANGGGKSPDGFDVKSSEDILYFDLSALAWNDDEFKGFFENLAFQEKALTYCLALREENKELFIPQGINMPDFSAVVDKLKAVLADEYDSLVEADATTSVALSGGDEEQLEGILAYSNECKQLGVFVSIVKIGKKLTIKFYTLFRPVDSDLTTQRKQVSSMYKKLSPSVTMWENSMKDTMLMAIEQLLNSNVQPSGNTSNVETSDTTSTEEISDTTISVETSDAASVEETFEEEFMF